MLTGRHNKGFSQKLGSLWPRTLNKEDGRQAGPGKRPAARGAHAAVSRIPLCLISSALEPRGVHGHPSAWCYKELLMAYFRGRPRLESGEVQGPGLSHRHAGQAGGHSAKKGRCWGHQRAVPNAKPWGWEVVIRQQDNWQVLAPAWAGRCRPPRPFAPHAGGHSDAEPSTGPEKPRNHRCHLCCTHKGPGWDTRDRSVFPRTPQKGQFCPWEMTTLGWNRGHSQQEAADRVLHAPTSLPPASPRFSRAARHPTAGAGGLELRPDRAWPN